jgi:DNA-binding LacI/PurR family transcriptional regulator
LAKKTVKTIEDIARLANVSKSTVSRALNDSPLISQETKDRIRTIARENHFRLHNPARQLSLRQSHTIAFVTHAYHLECFSMDDLFGLEIMGGVSAGLYERGYDMLVVHVNPRESDWAHQYLDSGRADGFILLTAARKQSHIKTLVEMDAPFIVWGVPTIQNKYCSVTGDNLTGGRLAAEHLIAAGRKKIAFLGGPREELEVQLRYRGYETALNDAGLAAEPDLAANGNYTSESGAEAMRQLLIQRPDLDAVFSNSDLMAIAAINVLRELGKRVPEDVAVVGYDDLSIANLNTLPLTTIRQNVPLAGKLLAHNLVQYLQTRIITNTTVPVELVVRKSA